MKGPWSRREGRVLLGVLVLATVAAGDYWYRSLVARRQALERQSQDLQAQLHTLRQGSLVIAEESKPVAGEDPMVLLMDPPGLLLTQLHWEAGLAPAGGGVSWGAEGHFNEFIAYLGRLESAATGWRWVAVDYKVKDYPTAEIRVRLIKPVGKKGG